MSLEDIISKTVSDWMKGTGPESDIALGSRVRLARNLTEVPFPGAASEEQLRQVTAEVRRIVQDERSFGRLEYVPMSEISPLERQILVEKHLISPQQAEDGKHKAVVLRDDEAISVMVNEEDHLRIQALSPGLQLERAFELCDRVDNAFEGHLDYAFSDGRGYLTSCPTNVGTGMRASVMLHLPALTMTEQMHRIVGTLPQFGLAVRGLYGEGTKILGNIYQLSNQVTLGHTEKDIIDHLTQISRQIIEQERQSRQHVVAKDRLQLEDRIWRSYGALGNARVMSSQEAMGLLSDVRLGIDLGLIKGLEGRILQELLVLIRPAHLQKIMGRTLDPPERDAYRATLIRERLRLAEKGA